VKLVVADAGPLIALSRVGRLPLLRALFDDVLIPAAVLEELRLDETRPGVEQLAQAIAEEKWLRSMSPSAKAEIPGLDVGESAAINLAVQLECPLLMDERRGRLAARKRGLVVLGTGRVLLAAKQAGLVETVSSVLGELRNAGYRLSDDICRQLTELAEE